jgi:hypothetical protein
MRTTVSVSIQQLFAWVNLNAFSLILDALCHAMTKFLALSPCFVSPYVTEETGVASVARLSVQSIQTYRTTQLCCKLQQTVERNKNVTSRKKLKNFKV